MSEGHKVNGKYANYFFERKKKLLVSIPCGMS